MNDMRPNNMIHIFQNFEGYVSDLKLCTDKEVKAPFVDRDLSECLIDISLKTRGVSSGAIRNKGSLGDIPFTGAAETKWVPYDMCALYSDCNSGTFEAESKFDGIACNDGHVFPKLTKKSSFLRFNTPDHGAWLSEGTIEFWFKVNDPLQYEENSQLFSLYDEINDQDFFEIFIQGGELVCAPFGTRSVRNPIVAFTQFT